MRSSVTWWCRITTDLWVNLAFLIVSLFADYVRLDAAFVSLEGL